jgi:hypothetical protein
MAFVLRFRPFRAFHGRMAAKIGLRPILAYFAPSGLFDWPLSPEGRNISALSGLFMVVWLLG